MQSRFHFMILKHFYLIVQEQCTGVQWAAARTIDTVQAGSSTIFTDAALSESNLACFSISFINAVIMRPSSAISVASLR
jgi:hypothetical protein